MTAEEASWPEEERRPEERRGPHIPHQATLFLGGRLEGEAFTSPRLPEGCRVSLAGHALREPGDHQGEGVFTLWPRTDGEGRLAEALVALKLKRPEEGPELQVHGLLIHAHRRKLVVVIQPKVGEAFRLLLTWALEAPRDFPLEKNLSLLTLAERTLGNLTPEPYTRMGRTAVELLTPSALEEEGRGKGHCLMAGSWTQVLKGRQRFFSLRDWEGKRVATPRLRWVGERWQVAEVRGLGNAEVSRWVEDQAEELAQAASPREEVA